MTRPLVFIDFDGVINQFPDDKVIRRQGRTDWMEPDDPRRDTYSPDNWFGPDRRERLLVRDLGRRFTIRWNAELVARLDALDCFASMFVRQVRQCFSAVWADGFPRCRHRFPVM